MPPPSLGAEFGHSIQKFQPHPLGKADFCAFWHALPRGGHRPHGHSPRGNHIRLPNTLIFGSSSSL